MKKVILLLIALSTILFSCDPELLDLGFDYSFDGEFEVPVDLEPGELHKIASEEISLDLLDKLNGKSYEDIASVQLKDLTVTISDLNQDWSFLEQVTVYMLIDGVPHKMASKVVISQIEGNTLQLDLEADQEDLLKFLEGTTAQLEVEIMTNKVLDTPLTADTEATVRIGL